jgi:signal transduction histidine kinase
VSDLTGLPPVRADFHALGQVLGNLVSNAIKFSLPGTSVRVEVGKEQSAPDRLRITVHDEGPGLTVADCKDLFKPYQRLSARPTGGESSTGLGLSIAHDMITEMGGTIDFHSEVGRGASFWVTLPIA